jgi:hypothetical protein
LPSLSSKLSLAGIGTVLNSLLPRYQWASPSTSLDKKKLFIQFVINVYQSIVSKTNCQPIPGIEISSIIPIVRNLASTSTLTAFRLTDK